MNKKASLPIFPFSAIIGQEEMKLALQLNVIDPKIGGVMIMGDRGTGKSTTIRAIADLLPKIDIVKNDPFNSHPTDYELMSSEILAKVQNNEKLETEGISLPMIDLPLGATEDRVCGTIDIEKALTEGIKAFEPGLLAKANRGILYVDEVNLLDDHLRYSFRFCSIRMEYCRTRRYLHKTSRTFCSNWFRKSGGRGIKTSTFRSIRNAC